MKMVRAHELAEYNHFVRSEQESRGRDAFDFFVQDQIENAIEGEKIARALTHHGPPAPPPPKFNNGHSVIQWWAPWMKDAQDLPSTYNKRDRPAWFKGEILAYVGWQAIKYAGFTNVAQHTYHVY